MTFSLLQDTGFSQLGSILPPRLSPSRASASGRKTLRELSPSQPPGFGRNGRAGSAVMAQPRPGAVTTRCHPPPSPRAPREPPRGRRSRGAGTAPRGVPGHSGGPLLPGNTGGDQIASQARYCPVSMATLGCSILSAQRWTTGSRRSPALRALSHPEPRKERELFLLQLSFARRTAAQTI